METKILLKMISDLDDWVKKEASNQKISTKEFCDKHLFPEILDFKEFPKFIKKRTKNVER